jgi:peptide/nickel transport system substrate-binding protein
MLPDFSDRHPATTRRNLLAMAGVAATAGLAGCGGDADGDGDVDGDTGGQVTPTPDEIPMDGEFVTSIAANPSTFDPTITTDAASTQVTSQLYEQLIQMDWNVEPRAALASDYEQEDETTYRFDLREGIEFHTGEEMTADDVEHSFRRMIGTTNDVTVSAWYEDSEVVDDYTIRFSLSQPHAPFLPDVGAVPIVPASETAEDPEEGDRDFTEESIGTGPFTLETVEPDDRVVLSRNEDYWFEETDDMPGMAPWASVTYRVVEEQSAQQEALRSGELDMIDNANPIDLGTFDDAADTNVVSTTGLGFDFITFPVNQPPYTNPKFRRGITRLIPVADVIEAVWSGFAVEQGGPTSPGLERFYDQDFEDRLLEEWVGENREAATDLLDDAFEEEDIEKPFEVSLITNVNATRERWMEVIQQTLDETEYFDASLDIQAFDSLVPFLLGGDAAESTDLVGIGWTGGSDPDGHVNQLFHSDNHVPDGFNWNLYENDEVDRLIDEGRRTADVAERTAVYEDLAEILAEECPAAFMWTSEEYAVHRTDGVTNWRQHPNASVYFLGLYRPYLDQVAWEPDG